ncbi:MAG: hydrogenase expression/formation protein HypE [Candidatus Solibacter sp.]|nr:hydrogenase expression/formation protein HypE [Candidatus Solibacter sp.]
MADGTNKPFELHCPLPSDGAGRVTMAHGGGGRMTERLIEDVFLPAFGGAELGRRHDGAYLPQSRRRLAVTTDSFVVKPLLFPGGSIGGLAVHGTVNDLAMCGARPLYLTAGFILEEGLEIRLLRGIVDDMARAAKESGVEIITADTKVVERGKGDGVYINTSGIGECLIGETGPWRVEPGDAVIVSGDLGRHGIAILSVREGIEFTTRIESDAMALWPAVAALIDAGVEIHCLRDLTRGGLSSALNEIARARGVEINIDEASIPVSAAVRGACEFLGLDPLYVANEGRFCVIVPGGEAARTVEALKASGLAAEACVIGALREGRSRVVMKTRIGGRRIVDMLSGEQLPRIC